MFRFYKSVIILISLSVIACHPKEKPVTHSKPTCSATVKYATGFTIDYYPDYKKVTVISPWQKNVVYARYYLLSDLKTKTPNDGLKIKVPIQTIGTASGTHYEFISLLNEFNSIKGICNPKTIYNPTLLKKWEDNTLVDMGDPFSLNIERVQLLHPDVVMISGFNQEDPISKRLIEMGIRVVYNNEWMETSLLARAEWIKFVSAFYNKEVLADSIFDKIEKNYLAIKSKLKKITNTPSVMTGGNFKGTWYMPGGKSYMAGLLTDAGASYHYANDLTTGSLPLNFEVVLNNFRETDIWIGSLANNLDELISTDERHGLFKAAKNRQVYSFNNRITPTGGNDFWESGIAHPDVILADMIKVFHPELMPDYEFVYVKKLE